MKNLHLYFTRPSEIKLNMVSIPQFQEVTNGSCDSVIFHEINSIPYKDIKNILGLILLKIKYEGKIYLTFNNLHSIVSDIQNNKIEEEQVNKLLYNKYSSIFSENTLIEHIQSLEEEFKIQIDIKSQIYDDYLIKVELQKNVQ